MPLAARPAYALAAITGLLYFLAFPGLDLWPFSFVALAPLFVALRGQSPKRAAGLGWLAGFVMTMTGFYWLLEMLQVFSGFPLPLCLLFMVILCGYQGGRIALAGYLHGRAEARGWPAPLVFTLAFVASELLYPLLFPWYYAATLHNVPMLLQLADIGGPYLVAAVLCLINIAVAELVLSRTKRQSPDRKVLLAGGAAALLGLVYGLIRVPMVDAKAAESQPLRVGIVQANMPLLGRQQSIPVNKALSAEAKEKGAQLLVWGEAAISQSFDEATYERDVRRVVSKDLGVPAVLGGILRRSGEKDSHGRRTWTYFNTAMFADETGNITGRYDKQFLLAFGEYIPFGDTFPVLYEWSPNSGKFTPGSTIEPFVWGDTRISALICYEDIVPSFVRNVVSHAEPDIIVNLTNDAWFGDTTEPWIHFALAKLRAVEHHRYLVRATNSGLSGIIDPVGRTVVHGSTFRAETVLGDTHLMRTTTVYEVIGDIPAWLAAAAVVAMGFVRKKGAPEPEKTPEKPKKGDKKAEKAVAEKAQEAAKEPAESASEATKTDEKADAEAPAEEEPQSAKQSPRTSRDSDAPPASSEGEIST